MNIEKSPNKILLVLTRFLGDCLLATGMLRSLRLAYPKAIIDVIATPSGRWALEGNSDIDNLILVQQKLKFGEGVKLLRKHFRRYDLSITDKPSGKSELYALLFSKGRRFRVIEPKMEGTWRTSPKIFAHRVYENRRQEHRVIRNLELLKPLDIPLHFCVVAPEDDSLPLLPEHYIVVHVPASNQLKQWPISHWANLISKIIKTGQRIVLTGSPSKRDRCLITQLRTLIGNSEYLFDLSGSLSVAQTSSLIKKSDGYIGLDSGISHLASAHNVPIVILITVAPVSMWGPWPYGYIPQIGAVSPFDNTQELQSVNNVTILQSKKACSPCTVRHCVGENEMLSPCLVEILPEQVFKIILDKMIRSQENK
ncbi:hypothetical protein A134_00605 [Vibrio crassostreae 9CS106]|nr:hypothetical protein A134_00605 [Vibrio crassostreae 9CS106]